MKNKYGTVSFFLYILKRFPGYVAGRMLYAASSHLPVYICNVIFLKFLISALLEKKTMGCMLGALLCLAVFLLATDLFSSYYSNILQPKQAEKIGQYFYQELKTIAGKQELYRYDDPSFFDDMTYISKHFIQDVSATVSSVSDLLFGLLNIILVLGTFWEIGFAVMLIVVSAIAVSLLTDISIKRLAKSKKYEINQLNRKKECYLNYFFSRQPFAELRITKIGNIINKAFDRGVSEQKGCHLRYGKKLFMLGSLKETVSTNILLHFILFAYLLYEVLISKALPGSNFIASYNAANIMAGYLISVVVILGNLKESAFSYEKYVGMQNTNSEATQSRSDCMEDIHSIELRNVSFTYPGTEKPVLKNINLKLQLGETVAFVGRNGSGKTTLVHLLMGLYTPTEGELLVNGRSLTSEEYPAYRQKFASFFQKMAPMEATVAQNVALDVEFSEACVRSALEKASASNLREKPVDTVVGAEFDPNGLLLSGGEIQKLMLSYCFYSNKSLLVMDEASSALDPIAEKEFNAQVKELAQDQLAVLVSHRLSTVLMADYIYVLDDGKICEEGTHDSLIQKQGIYEKIWTIQASKYSQ